MSLGNTKILQNDFEYFEPETIDEAVSLFDKYGNEAKALAGGTDLLIRMKKGEIGPKYLLNIKGIQDLDYITEDEGLRIGAATTLRRIGKSQIIGPHLISKGDANAQKHQEKPEAVWGYWIGGNTLHLP